MGFCGVRARPRVLYVEGDPGQEKYLAAALRSQKIDADVTNPAGLPRNLAEFQNYDSVILSNVSALYLSTEQMKMMQSNVRDLGQGFGMIGGEDSFGVGGYYRTPIEEALPVDMDVTKQKEWPSTAVVCVIDKSGSMGMGGMGYAKVDLAKEAAIATLEVLGERDEYGVVCFDEAAKEVFPLQPLKNPGAVRDAIASIAAGGGTSMYPGMMMAQEWLAASPAKVKHCILLTDGMSLPGDFDGAIRALNRVGATLTSVAVGTDADVPLLQRLAQTGGGRFYYTEDPQALPRIFTKEALLVSKSLIVEEAFRARVDTSSEVLRGVDWASHPPLLGYVATTAKSLADVPMRTARNDPLFAHWRYGLGRSIAFTSDCKARWGAHWLQWPGYQKFWGQAVRWTLRRSTRANFQTTVDLERGRGHITVDAVDDKGQFVNFLKVRANVVSPDMAAQALELRQSGPGRYEGNFPATAIGAYMVNVSRSGPGGTAAQTSGIAISYPPEYRDLKTNTFVLTRLAERTRGKLLTDAGQVFSRNRQPARVPVEIWPALLLIALLLFPLDVALRRVMIEPAEVLSWLGERARALRLRRKSAHAPARQQTLGRLLDRKATVVTRRPDSAQPAGREAQPVGEPAQASAVPAPGAVPAHPLASASAPPGAGASAPDPAPAQPAAGETPPRVAPAPSPAPSSSGAPRTPPRPAGPEPDDPNLSPTERLLRAKRRARGE